MKWMAGASVVGIQETHGSDQDLKLTFQHIAETHCVFYSAHNNPTGGRVATFWKKEDFPANAFLSNKAMSRGRILRTELHND